MKVKVVLQRTGPAKVTVDGEVTGAIEKGYVLLVGITHDDVEEDVAFVAKKLPIYVYGKMKKER